MGVMPWLSRWAFSSISSVTMDLPLVTARAPRSRRIAVTMSRASAASRAQCTCPPFAWTLASNCSSSSSRCESACARIERAASRKPSTSASPASACARLTWKPSFRCVSALCRRASPSAARAACGKRCASLKASPRRSPVAIRSPAITSAAWRTASLSPRRAIRPDRCSRQPRSPPTSISAPVLSASAILSSAMRADTSGYFTEKNPPKPQQVCGSLSSHRRSPSTDDSSCRGSSFIAHLAQRRAGIVIGDARAARRRDRRDAAHIHQEREQFVRLRRERGSALGPCLVVRQHSRIVHADHARARSRRHDDEGVGFERRDDVARHRRRGRLIAAVIGRLAATALQRHVDLAARLFEQLGGGKPDLRPEHVGEAGHEQRNPRRLMSRPCPKGS